MAKRKHITFLLDMTGSMLGNKAETIQGHNSYVETVRGEDPKARYMLITFNSGETKNHGVKKIAETALLSEETYKPDNMTPLYDAIGYAIRETERVTEDKEREILLMILTDGLENCSQELTGPAVKDLIANKQGAGWTIVFMGKGLDVAETGTWIGVAPGNVIATGQAGVACFATAATATVRHSRAGGQSVTFWTEEDRTTVK